MTKRIKKANITRVALVPRGANRLPALYKSDGSLELAPLSKFEPERGELLTLVYVPEKIDAQGHFADRECVALMAHSHMKNGAVLDICHGDTVLTKEQAYVAESFVVQKGDARFAGWKDMDGNAVDATGGWGQLIKIDDPEIRKLYGQEGWEGVSLFAPAGKAELETVSDQIVERFRKSKDNDMDAKELTAALAANNEALVAALAKALTPKKDEPTPEIKKIDPPKEETPILALADRMNPEKVRKYQKELKIHALQKETVWTDQKSIDTYLAKVAELEGKPKEETDEVRSLRKQLEKAIGASSQPDSKDDSTLKKERSLCEQTGLSKEELDAVRAGNKAAEWLNKNRGFAASK